MLSWHHPDLVRHAFFLSPESPTWQAGSSAFPVSHCPEPTAGPSISHPGLMYLVPVPHLGRHGLTSGVPASHLGWLRTPSRLVTPKGAMSVTLGLPLPWRSWAVLRGAAEEVHPGQGDPLNPWPRSSSQQKVDPTQEQESQRWVGMTPGK